MDNIFLSLNCTFLNYISAFVYGSKPHNLHFGISKSSLNIFFLANTFSSTTVVYLYQRKKSVQYRKLSFKRVWEEKNKTNANTITHTHTHTISTWERKQQRNRSKGKTYKNQNWKTWFHYNSFASIQYLYIVTCIYIIRIWKIYGFPFSRWYWRLYKYIYIDETIQMD